MCNLDSIVTEVAWFIWNNQDDFSRIDTLFSEEAIIAAINDDIIIKKDNIITVSDKNKLTRRAAYYYANNILINNIDEPALFFANLRKIWVKEISESTALSGLSLSIIQNNNIKCIFSLAKNAIISGIDVFYVIHVLNKAIKYINDVDIDALFDFEISAYESTSRDLAGDILHNGFIVWFEKHTETASKVLNKFIELPKNETGTIFSCALIGLGNNKFEDALNIITQLLKSDNLIVIKFATHALGKLNWTDANTTQVKLTFDNLINELKKKNPESCLASSLAIQDIVTIFPEYYRNLFLLADANTVESLSALSWFLFKNINQFEKYEWYNDLLYIFSEKGITDRKITNNLDHVLSSYIKYHDKNISNWMRQWIINQNNKGVLQDVTHVFDATFLEYLKYPKELEAIVTSWLTENDLRLPRSAMHIANYITSRNKFLSSFDTKQLETMERQDFIFLVTNPRQSRGLERL